MSGLMRNQIFISYARADNESPDPSKRWLDRLVEQLKPLQDQGQIDVWSDQDISMGETWHERIQASLGRAKAAVLLVSPAFLASEYIRNSELPVLLKQAQDQGTVVIPIILRHCTFHLVRFKYPDPRYGPQELLLSSFQAANPPGKPLNALPEDEQDKILVSVAERLLEIVSPNP